MHGSRSLALASTALTIALGGCVATSPTEPTPNAPITALSWNVRYGTANDGVDSWPARRTALAAAIVAQQPAILGVQEALKDQLEFLAGQLPDHVRLGQGRDGGDRGEHAALFVDRRRFEVLAHGDFWLSPTPEQPASVGWDAALTRICTWARLRERDGSRTLTVWNAHFDHRGAMARTRSAELLAERVRTSPGPHLVLGDLNCGERSAPLDALRAAGLRDTFRDLHAAQRAVGTFHAFRGGTDGDKIDYVLADAGLVTTAAAILSAPGPNGRWPSDHHGVVATVSYRE
jgi:endonuclease/exonuclease/phosphatase family metal-dependent hydrolase